MESSLHRQLKDLYADRGSQLEARVDQYRIDVVCDGELIEIQHGSLGAIRDKVHRLLHVNGRRVLVVKPIVVRKHLVRLDERGGRVVSRRLSPKRGTILDLFHELIHFTRVFPHENLCVEVPLVDVEERRYPGHGRRRRRRDRDHQVEDQSLLQLHRIHRFRTAKDLLRLLPDDLPDVFHTGQLAEAAGTQRWIAQRIAYCLRKTGAAVEVGKNRNTRLYRLCG
jgi:hypothetical protein